MRKEPAKKLPLAILQGRDLVNQLATEGFIKLLDANPYWSKANLKCFPFDSIVTFNRETSEFQLEIVVGRVFDTSGMDILNTLPIPVNYSYSLDPIPTLSLTERITVDTSTDKSEMWNFIKLAVVKTLMSTHALLVTDSFDGGCKKRIEGWNFPNAQSPWDYYAIAEEILKDR